MAPSYVPDPGREPRPGGREDGTLEGEVADARARAGAGTVLLEGVHALKHAVRFGARLRLVVTPDADELTRLLEQLAPDVALPVEVAEVSPERWRRLVPRETPSPVLAVAERPPDRLDDVLAASHGRLVVLEQPRHLGNLGAAVRVAAAADAAGLVVVGDADPWHPTALRAGAGLQFALPVGRRAALPTTARPLVALDPAGDEVSATALPPGAALLFGTERGGLSDALRARTSRHVSIPMRAGVSSLNLASAVAVALYAR